MDQAFREKKRRKLRILVAPLDWGLGHATRCIPIIRELLKQDCEVLLAGEGAQEILLKREFPRLLFIPLCGYRIRYSKTSAGLAFQILRQIPKINKSIRLEHEWLKEAVKKYQLDGIISDNRYGLYHDSLFCVFITHQLRVKTNWGGWSERILRKMNFHYIEQFSECWVPDNETGNNLAGALSHTDKKIRIPLHYIGWLSRFEKSEQEMKRGHLLFLLSGPEPQRTVFENLVIDQIVRYNGSATVVRGLPNDESTIPSTHTIKFYNHLAADELGTEMEKAEYIIARSGYSTIMDIVRLQKKSMLIPTPGQTEQEYLARSLSEKKITLSLMQKDFSLQVAIAKAKSFTYRFFEEERKLSVVISTFIRAINKS